MGLSEGSEGCRRQSGHKGVLGEGRTGPKESDAQGLSFARDGTFQNECSLSVSGRSAQ